MVQIADVKKPTVLRVGFFNSVVQNDIASDFAGTLFAAGKAFDTAHHFTHRAIGSGNLRRQFSVVQNDTPPMPPSLITIVL